MDQQELFYKFNLLERKAKQIQEQLEAIEQNTLELSSLKNDLEEINGSEGKEMYASIGRGIYIKAKILSEKLNVDVGGKKFVKKTPNEAKELIEKQLGRLDEAREILNKQLEEMNKELASLVEEAKEE